MGARARHRRRGEQRLRARRAGADRAPVLRLAQAGLDLGQEHRCRGRPVLGAARHAAAQGRGQRSGLGPVVAQVGRVLARHAQGDLRHRGAPLRQSPLIKIKQHIYLTHLNHGMESPLLWKDILLSIRKFEKTHQQLQIQSN